MIQSVEDTKLSLSFKKSGDKKVTKKPHMQYDKILEFMQDEKEYGIWDLGELLGLKESRTKDILKGLSDYIEIVGSNRNRHYKKKLPSAKFGVVLKRRNLHEHT